MEYDNIIHICSLSQAKYGAEITEEIKKNHPDKNVVEWDLSLYQQLITKHYPELLNLIDSFDFDIQTAFVGRIAALHRYGGLLMSSSMRPVKHLGNLFKFSLEPDDSYIKSNSPEAVLFEHFPFDFEENSRISTEIIIAKKTQNS